MLGKQKISLEILGYAVSEGHCLSPYHVEFSRELSEFGREMIKWTFLVRKNTQLFNTEPVVFLV